MVFREHYMDMMARPNFHQPRSRGFRWFTQVTNVDLACFCISVDTSLHIARETTVSGPQELKRRCLD